MTKKHKHPNFIRTDYTFLKTIQKTKCITLLESLEKQVIF